jgi:hypothetical protein
MTLDEKTHETYTLRSQHGSCRYRADVHGNMRSRSCSDFPRRRPVTLGSILDAVKIACRMTAEGGKISKGPHPRNNNMTPHIPEEFSIRLIDWSPFVIMGNKMPPRDPDEDEQDEDEDEEDPADEPPVVREPDED